MSIGHLADVLPETVWINPTCSTGNYWSIFRPCQLLVKVTATPTNPKNRQSLHWSQPELPCCRVSLTEPDFCAYIFSGTLGGSTVIKMTQEEIIKVKYNELPLYYKELVAKSIEFQIKCLESCGKTRNKVIMKSSLPKIVEAEDIEVVRKMFWDTIHEVVHQALINES